ncbi:hypothetical protein, partial [Propionivibrio sp.]|uniref:hypothetical protein n=1 Tax=Propionivibrio sp. TaxID=2212460 RepID=UPI003BF25A6D
AEILQKEAINAEPAALRLLGQAARGSMRDGLSLLDQAIAYSAGSVSDWVTKAIRKVRPPDLGDFTMTPI